MTENNQAYIQQRRQEGIDKRKAAGLYTGRKPIEVDKKLFEKEYGLWKSGYITVREAMDVLGLKPNTFYRRVREFERRKFNVFNEITKSPESFTMWYCNNTYCTECIGCYNGKECELEGDGEVKWPEISEIGKTAIYKYLTASATERDLK